MRSVELSQFAERYGNAVWAVVLADVGRASMGFSQALLDTFAIGDGVAKAINGNPWGLAEDGFRVVNLLPLIRGLSSGLRGAQAVRVAAISANSGSVTLAKALVCPSSNTCLPVAMSRAIVAVNQRHFVSLDALLRQGKDLLRWNTETVAERVKSLGLKASSINFAKQVGTSVVGPELATIENQVRAKLVKGSAGIISFVFQKNTRQGATEGGHAIMVSMSASGAVEYVDAIASKFTYHSLKDYMAKLGATNPMWVARSVQAVDMVLVEQGVINTGAIQQAAFQGALASGATKSAAMFAAKGIVFELMSVPLIDAKTQVEKMLEFYGLSPRF